MINLPTKFEVPLWRYERRCKMSKIGWFQVVRGHIRSSPMSVCSGAHMISDSSLIETASVWYRFRDTASYLSKFANFDLPHNLHLAPPFGVTPFEFRKDFWRQKTRVPGLSCSVVCVFLCLAVLVEHRLVTDRRTRTDGHTTMAYTAQSIARAVKITFHTYNALLVYDSLHQA